MNGLAAKNAESVKPWPMVRLGDVCEVKAGATHHGIESANGKYPVYGSGGYICHATEYRCPAGTVTVGRKGTLDNPLLINEPFWNIDTCFGVIPKEKVDARYLWRFCQNFDFYNLVPSLGRPSTNSDAIRNIQIPLPPLSVQKEIVERLEKELGEADKVAAEFKRMADLADKEFKAELDEMFGEVGEKGSGVSSQELGLAAKNAESAKAWPMVRLGDVFDVVSARRVHKSDWKTKGIPFYRTREIVKLADFGCVENQLFISENLYERYKNINGVPQANDLMVSAVGTIGRIYIVKEGDRFYYKDASVLCFKNKLHVNPWFAKYYFESPKFLAVIHEESKGATVDTITMERAKEYPFLLPSVNVQKGIVAKLDAAKERCEKLKAEAERGLKAAENLRKAILSEAFE